MNLRTSVTFRIAVTIVAVASGPPRSATAQSAPATMNPVGTWRGVSVCLVRPSACNDETVVYRITPLKAPDSLALDARKIVRGQEEDMGVLACRVLRQNGEITCMIPRGVWNFRVRSDSLNGELLLADKTRFRVVRTKRTR